MRFRLKKGIEEEPRPIRISKKQLFLGLLALCIILSVSWIIIKRVSSNSASSYQGTVSIKKDACKLFSLNDAKKVLGKSAEASKNNANAVSSKATVSTCSYSSGSEKLEDLIALTILIRTSNKIQARQAFELARTQDSKDVKNFGDQAYYTPETSQLNILKDDTWIIIANSKASTGKGESELPKKVATIILQKF